MPEIDYNPFDGRYFEDPYPVYRRLRDEAPVFRVPDTDVYCVSRYEDVRHVFKTPEQFPSVMGAAGLAGNQRPGLLPLLRGLWRLYRAGINPLEGRKARMLIGTNGRQHQDMRNVVNKGFTPSRIARWEPRAREIVAGCMENIRNAKRVELVRELANPLPMAIITELLGVESERQADFKRWSDAVIQSTGTGADPGNASESMIEPWAQITRYVRPLVRQRREQPQDDLISVIVAKENGSAALSEFEVAMFIGLLLVAGNETTTNLIGNTAHALYDHPDQLDLLLRRPELIPNLIEEMLRFDGPVQILLRGCATDVELGGGRIPAGATVSLMVGSANRDERQFPDSERLDVTRDASGHLGLGIGEHFCLGSSLARLEARCMLEALVPALPRFERSGKREFVESFIIRGTPRLELAAAA